MYQKKIKMINYRFMSFHFNVSLLNEMRYNFVQNFRYLEKKILAKYQIKIFV